MEQDDVDLLIDLESKENRLPPHEPLSRSKRVGMSKAHSVKEHSETMDNGYGTRPLWGSRRHSVGGFGKPEGGCYSPRFSLDHLASPEEAATPEGVRAMASSGAFHGVALRGVTRLLGEMETERKWVLAENERLHKARREVTRELRVVEKNLIDLMHKKNDLEEQLGKIGARQRDVKGVVDALDRKISTIGEESARFERQIRSIKGDEAPRLSVRDSRHAQRDLDRNACIKTLYGHTGAVMTLQYDEDRGVLISGGADGAARIWDVGASSVRQVLSGHTGWVRSLQFDRRHVVTASGDTTLRLWDVNSGRCNGILEGHDAGVACVRFEGARIVSGSGDRTVRTWDMETQQNVMVLEEHTLSVNTLKFYKYGLATGSGDCTIRMWDLRSGKCHRVLEGHEAGISSLEFDRHQILSGSHDGSLRQWDLRTGSCIRATQVGKSVMDLTFDDQRVIVAPDDNSVHVYDVNAKVRQLVLQGHAASVRAVHLTDSVLVSGSVDQSIKLWSLSKM